MNAQILDWSDVPFLLAVCEEGSLSGAARTLNVNHSTVFRRVEAAEARLGVRLFERLSQGYVMTPEGEFFLEQASVLRDGLTSIERKLSGGDLRLSGVLSVTTTDSLHENLIPITSAFQDEYPEIELRMLVSARPLDLAKREADIAIRPTASPPEHWFGRKAAMLEFAVYAHRDYLTKLEEEPDSAQRWFELDDDLRQSPMSKMTKAKKPSDARTTIVTTLIGVANYVRSGSGLAVLPCYMGERIDGLERIDGPDPTFSWDLWLLAHPDLKRSAKVHAFFEFVGGRISRDFSGLCE